MKNNNSNNQDKNKAPIPEEETFAKLPRAWRLDYLERKLTLDEMWVLVWLTWEANPHNGIIATSYAGIVSDLSGSYTKNRVNKIMLELKRKHYLWYPVQKGRRSSFRVEIANYLLSNKASKDISHRFTSDNSRSKDEDSNKSDGSEINDSEDVSRSYADLDQSEQRLKGDLCESNAGYLTDYEDDSGRSTNNDKDTNNDLSSTYKKKLREFTEENPSPLVAEYRPKTFEEQECRDIALWLGEKSMNFILARLESEGIEKIKSAYAITLNKTGKKDFSGNRGSYFNKVLQDLDEVDGTQTVKI